jgi:dTDP-4-amino-4,6-dideoxygalactose transaminase/predicted dehydrogenase
MNPRAIISRLSPSAKEVAKSIARQTIGRLPPPTHRLTGKLARFGGTPVRDVRFRPWADYHANNARHWAREVGPALKRIFVSGREGLPQTLTKELALRWAEYCGVRYALILPHGTDALRIAIAATLDHDGLEYGGEIIVPNFSFVASANAALDRRFGVALVDVDPYTLNIDPQRVAEAIQPGRTKAIMPVHLFGQPADMAALKAIAHQHNLKIIEDAAQAHGAQHELGPAGSLGNAGAFSFQSSKNISCGEGGALTTNDPNIYERAWQIHNVGRARIGGQRWGHETLGWNCRSTEYVAAILLHRLRLLEEQQTRRFKNFMLLRALVKDIPAVEFVGLGPDVVRHGVHMAALRYHQSRCDGVKLDDYLKALTAEGIPANRAYPKTIAQQPAFVKLRKRRPDFVRVLPTPVSERAVTEIFCIDQNVFLGSEADMQEIAAAFEKLQKYFSPRSSQRDVVRLNGQAASNSATPSVKTPTVAVRKTLRCGIIGFGFMGQVHANALAKSDAVKLTAVSDVAPKARHSAQKFGGKWYDSPQELVTSREVDAVIVATPHWQHAELSIAAMRAGLHVMCEKPLAVTISQADAMLEAAEEAKVVFAGVHQTRFQPAYQLAKKLLDSGELGPIHRCSTVETLWRTEAYYRSSPWRATWKGEGGGVLLNQAPHVIDRYAWLCGMPETLWARCDTALHQIEVEDVASALLRHANGMHGYIHVSTNECPAISRTVIACDRGRIEIEGGNLRVTRMSRSIKEFTASLKEPWGEIPSETRDMGGDLSGSFEELLVPFYDNFAEAVHGNATLVSPAVESRNAVELANAFMFSSESNGPIALPLDRAAYDNFIARKTGSSL